MVTKISNFNKPSFIIKLLIIIFLVNFLFIFLYFSLSKNSNNTSNQNENQKVSEGILPKCGDGKCSLTENSNNCCIDCGCSSGFTCDGQICRTSLCDYTSGENCQNNPSKCNCKINQICSPDRSKSDNLGCYTPVCGDGYKDSGETSETCCIDAGCPSNLVCDANLNRCVKPQCPFDCCENDQSYQDKSCPEYYSCNSQEHSCKPIDSDNDAFPDYMEIQTGTDKYDSDTDGDTVFDGYDNHPLSSYLPRTYNYDWRYGKEWLIFTKDFQFSITLSEDVVSSYEKMPKDKLISRDDIQLKEVAQKLNQLATAENYNDADKLMMVIAFSRSFNYDYTKASFVNKPLPDWANFPMETIVKKQGLCADSAVMTTALLREMGYDAQYLGGPCWDYTAYHAIVGIPYVDGITLKGSERYVNYNGKKYYYIDATSSDSKGNLFYSTTSKDDFGTTFCSMNEFTVNENY